MSGNECNGWRVDKRVNLATLLTLVSGLLLAVNTAASLGARLSVMEEKLCAVERRVEEAHAAVIKVERIAERVQGMQETLVDIRSELRRRAG